ncbi:MAG: hypothetical protein M4579_006258 [Chaenotheca gracillima]|nr:MAG: hypothetical protein M4579_006258 [Chaenotheca gracillima]
MSPRIPPLSSCAQALRPNCRLISSSRCLFAANNPISALAASLDTEKSPNSSRDRSDTSKPPAAGNSKQRQGQFNYLRDMVSRGNRGAARMDRKRNQRGTMQELEAQTKAADVERLMHRRFKQGDVYAPHDLSSTEMIKWRRRNKPTKDAFDALAINPIDEYKNFSMMSEYMTEMGRIKHGRDTALRPVNQRRVAKAIRRAIGIGLIPSAYRHPELLMMSRNRSQQYR